MKLATTVPAMPDPTPAHPHYGTCPNCTRAVRVLKGGWLQNHRTPEYACGNAKVAYRCSGSGKRYAEYGERPKGWDFTAGDWNLINIDVPVLINEGDGYEWKAVEIFQTELHVRLRRYLVPDRVGAEPLWRIEIEATPDRVEGTLLREDVGWVPVASTEMSRHMLGMSRLVMWLLVAMEKELDDQTIRHDEAVAAAKDEGPF